MATVLEVEELSEQAARQLYTKPLDRSGLEQVAHQVRDLAIDLESVVDQYMQTRPDLSPACQNRLRKQLLDTALCAVRATLDDTTETEVVAYLDEALHTANETITLLQERRRVA